MSAEHSSHRLGRRGENSNFQFAHFDARRASDLRDRYMARITEGGRNAKADRRRILLQALDEITPGSERSISAYSINNVFAQHLRQRSDVFVREWIAARDRVRQQRGRRD